MRNIKRITTGVIWFLIGICVLPFILLQIPTIQEYIAGQTATLLSDKIGVPVSVDRINYGLFNRIIIDGVTINDRQQQEMIKSARISAKVDVLPLLNGKISVSSAQIFGTHINIYQPTAESEHNIQFLIDALASKDTTSSNPLDLRVNSLIIRHSSVSYNRHFIPETPEKLNPNHLEVSDISAHILLKALRQDSINCQIKKLALKEHSGAVIDKLTLHFEAGRHGGRLTDFNLVMPNSHLTADSIVATFEAHGNKIKSGTLRFHGAIGKSQIGISDLAFLQPAFDGADKDIVLESRFHGTDGEFTLDHLHAAFNADVIAKALALNDSTIGRIGNIAIETKGRIDTLGSGNIDIRLNTDAGNLKLLASADEKHRIQGKLLTDTLNATRILPKANIGRVMADINISGLYDSNEKKADIKMNGTLPHFEYNRYTYRNIGLEASYNPDRITGGIDIDDINAIVDIDADLALKGNKHDLILYAHIDTLMPKALNLSDKWDEACFTGKIEANVIGTGIDDLTGTVNLSDVAIASEKHNKTLKRLTLNSENNKGERVITLNSDFANIRLNGRFGLATLYNSLINNIASKLPTLPGLPARMKSTDNTAQLYAEFYDTEWLDILIGLPLKIYDNTTIVGKIDDRTGEMYANCLMPAFVFDNTEYQNAYVAITSPDDTLNYDIGIDKIHDGGYPMKLKVTGKAADNRLSTSINIDNNAEKRLLGTINAAVLFDNADGNPMAKIDILPSELSINGNSWDITPANITYSDKRIAINNLSVSSNRQSITIDGIASALPEEQLRVNLRNIDVTYVLDLVNFRSVRFDGFATGRAYINAPFGDMKAKGKLMVDKFKFEKGRMGTLDANVEWNTEEKRIDISAVADDGPDAITYVNGYVSPSPGFIDLDIKAAGTHLDFMESFTSSFTNDVNGHVNGAVKLIGPLSAVNLVGELVVDGEMFITPLNCKYYLRNDTVRCVPDQISLRSVPFFDVHGNKGLLSGNINHKHLTQLTYDLFVNTDKLLVYDFRDFGKEVFHGTIYGAGDVSIHGRRRELTMNVDMSTLANSSFTYNVSTPDAIVDQKFITWNKREPDNKKKGLNEARRNETIKPVITSDTYINFKINATPEASLRFLMDNKTNDYITLHGNGMLNASFHNKSGFNMFGTYYVERGTYTMTIQDIIKKNFTFKEGGTLTFVGNPENANLNLQAVHTVNGVSLADLNVGSSYSDNTTRVNCLLNITGKPFDLQLDFGIELPTASSEQERNIRSVIQGEDEMKQQVIYLLGFGRFMPQSNSNVTAADENRMSQTTQAMQGLLSGTISTQINNVLNSAINNNNWNFGANISTGDEGWHNAEYEGLLSGRLLNNRLLINGQFGYRDNPRTASSSFIGDFDVRYLLIPNGNLALKVYNQTNDRYFTKSSLNTQGVGLIMKKDFINLKDLFRRQKKAKKTSK